MVKTHGFTHGTCGKTSMENLHGKPQQCENIPMNQPRLGGPFKSSEEISEVVGGAYLQVDFKEKCRKAIAGGVYPLMFPRNLPTKTKFLGDLDELCITCMTYSTVIRVICQLFVLENTEKIKSVAQL